MYNNNLHEILHLMAVREFDIAYRACSMGTLPTKQRCLRWTVEEEARQMVHIFDDLSTVRFNWREKGVIRQHSHSRATLACSHAESFYFMYHEHDQWGEDERELFNQLVYLRAVKLAEIATGIRMDFNWLDTTLRSHAEHPHAISLNRESYELRDRICRGEFEPTEDEVSKLSKIFPNLEKSLDDALTNTYGFVYSTMQFLWYDDPVVFGSHIR